MRLSLRARFALLAAALVVLVASLVGLVGYLSFRASLHSRAAHSARTEAVRLAGLVASSEGQNGQGVDLTDASLTGQLATPGLVVSVARPNGAVVQARTGPRNAMLASDATRRACLARGQVQTERSSPPLAVACVRVGSLRAPLGTVTVGSPLGSSLASLAALRRILLLGVIGGGGLAALLALLLARRALRPLTRIAQTAETIRSGDLTRRIGYRGGDELGHVARVLDQCFAELEGAVERQRRFAADASHELKTPLAAIRANVELLRGWAGGDEESRRTTLESLDQSSRRASRLVADLLALVRSEREPLRPRTLVRLDEVVLSAVREAAPLRDVVSVRVTRLDDLAVRGDPHGLQQVLVNLLDNALAASPPAGEVTVALRASEDGARVTVSDEGPGLGADEAERIFDRFYSKKRHDADKDGAGLGLAIARSITRNHGGDVTGRNNDDVGATFEMILPLLESSVGPSTRIDGHEESDYPAGSRTTNRAPASLG